MEITLIFAAEEFLMIFLCGLPAPAHHPNETSVSAVKSTCRTVAQPAPNWGKHLPFMSKSSLGRMTFMTFDHGTRFKHGKTWTTHLNTRLRLLQDAASMFEQPLDMSWYLFNSKAKQLVSLDGRRPKLSIHSVIHRNLSQKKNSSQ